MHFNEQWLSQSGFSWPAAYGLVSAARLSYKDFSTIENVAWTEWGLLASNFEVADTRGYILHGKDNLVFVFRGTDSVHDMLVDLDAFRVPDPVFGGDVHEGFLGTYRGIEEIVRAALEGVGERRVWYVGHSSGGALALLAAMYNAHVGVNGVFTFGQPRLLDVRAAKTVEQTLGHSYCRFAASDDLVTKVPPGFWHTGLLVSFNEHGVAALEDEAHNRPVSMEVDGALSTHEFAMMQLHAAATPAEMEKASEEGFFLFDFIDFLLNVDRHHTNRYLAHIHPYAMRVSE